MRAAAMWDGRAWLALAVVCGFGLALAARSIADETAVSLDGDMARYLMNGAFLRDFLQDMPLAAPLEWAQRYYARYPAISLGHHPILPAMAEAGFFLVFGVSVFSARLSTLCALALTLIFWFRLIRETYDIPTAIFATLLLLSTPGLLPLFEIVLSEPYALCFITLSLYFMHRYCTTERRRDAVAFGVSVVLSIYAKQLAAFLFPVYAFQFVNAFGLRRLFRRSTLVTIAAITLCMLPIVPLTLRYSPFNIMLITEYGRPAEAASGSRLLRLLGRLWGGQPHPSIPVLGLCAVSVVGALVRRDWRILWLVVWIVAVYFWQVLLGVSNPRFAVYWLPAFCALGAAACQLGSRVQVRAAWTIVVAAIVGYQFWQEAQAVGAQGGGFRPVGAGGYEEAARYVSEHPLGDAILYSAAVDTGYFVFFVRKHDPRRESIVLRADKVLTTSRMRFLDFGQRIRQREEILPILKRYGVGYVVVEDRTYPEGPLRWLQDVVQTPDFDLRRRLPIVSSDRRMTEATLSIYEYRGLTPADPDATLAIDLPVMNDRIQLRLADLLTRRAASSQ